jgi:hypothetical protein
VDLWDKIWRIALDPSVDSLDIIYAALEKKIYRSDDGGLTWAEVLNGTGLGYIFTDIQVSSTGIAYATLSSSADDKGIWRSADHGLSWTRISAGSGWPSNYNRIVLAISPSDQNTVYFLANTPNNGQMSEVFFGGTDWNSLWKYTYVGGNGADTNGVWTDLSMNIPANGLPMDNFNAQGSYNLVVAVKPDDPNTVFIGGTNLYRSTDGFTSTNNTTHIGGYNPGSTIPFYEVYPNHHPDNHALLFLPSDNNTLISATDGGVFKTLDCSNQLVSWESLLNGYVTSQFYTIAIDHGADNSQVIFGGLQDNGTWWTNSSDPTALWTMPSAGDGSYCAVEDGGGVYYFSRQRGRIIKTILDQNGIPTSFRRMDPITTDTINGGNYLFINPFILDPTDNNTMYLSEGTNLWRNNALSSIALTNEYDTISTGWTKMTNLAPISNTYITALACSETNPNHRLYYGIYNRKIYRIDSAHTGNPYSTEITNNITSGGFTSCIAIDPRDADKVMIVYSNYNVYSLYYSEDGGNYWMKVGGNLETGPPAGAPPSLDYWGDGPSCRWAKIIPWGEDSTLFVLATSVGLFTTHELIDESISSDSTIWIPQAANTIGNVVVDMIDYRDSDGFLVVGTHGTGVYSTKIKEDTTSTLALSTLSRSINVNVYPNPTSDYTNVEFSMENPGNSSLKVFNNSGKCVIGPMAKKLNKGKQQLQVSLGDLPNGVYFIRLELDSQLHSIKVLKH